MHRAGMNPAQRHRHPPDLHRQRIARHEHAAIGEPYLRPFIKAERAQPLRFFGNECSPIDRNDARKNAKGELIECHPARAATADEQLQVIRNS